YLMATLSLFKVVKIGITRLIGCFKEIYSSFPVFSVLILLMLIMPASVNCLADNIELKSGEKFGQRTLFNKIVQSSTGRSPSLTFLMDYFTGTPYVPHTLENNETEKLIVRLDAFDCVTYVETVTALAMMFATTDHSYESFCKQLTDIRYRNGIINGYSSRLHYFSDWLHENEHRGFISNITEKLGGKPDTRIFSAMSSSYKRYPMLKENKHLAEIRNIEANLSKKTFYYLETTEVKQKSHLIPDCAIIAIVTSKKSIFISHVGFARFINGKLMFQHASFSHKKVVISKQNLHDYLASDRSRIGIMVAVITTE
ncbi:MAG: DUF1460 domain-containing protein, partial [Spirochaetes bacterium]|nr:DUF1460 domain-containing protein [Spirochaetota bacterium]